MRKVEFSLCNQSQDCQIESVWVKAKGYFHGFFQKTDYNRFGADHKVIAIVEDFEGQIHELFPEDIKFIEDNTLKVL